MRKTLLATASVLAFSLVTSGVMASGGDSNNGAPIEDNNIVAKTYQEQTVKASGEIEVKYGSGDNSADVGGTGMINVQQNNGNNAGQQAANTVAAIVGCDCAGGVEDNRMFAKTDQDGYVKNYGDISVKGATLSNLATVGGTGLINVQQNNGNNVSQQAGNTLSAIIGGSSSSGGTGN